MKSSTEAEIYAREAERARSQLSASIDELRGRLTIGDVVEEMVGYMRVGGSNVMAGLGTAMRDNPVPTMLIATGCAMYLRGSGVARARGSMPRAGNGDGYPAGYNGGYGTVAGEGRRHGRRAGDAVSGAGETLRGAAGAVGSAVSGAAGAVSSASNRVASAVDDAAGAAGQTLRRATDSAYDAAAAAGETVRDSAASAAEAASEAARGAKETAREYATAASERASQTLRDAERSTRELYDSVMRLAEEQPLLVAAIGVAIGAAIGAALPSTRVEDELLGESADAVKRAATGAIDDVGETLRREGGAVAQEVRQAAGQAGDAIGAPSGGAGSGSYGGSPGTVSGATVTERTG